MTWHGALVEENTILSDAFRFVLFNRCMFCLKAKHGMDQSHLKSLLKREISRTSGAIKAKYTIT